MELLDLELCILLVAVWLVRLYRLVVVSVVAAPIDLTLIVPGVAIAVETWGADTESD